MNRDFIILKIALVKSLAVVILSLLLNKYLDFGCFYGPAPELIKQQPYVNIQRKVFLSTVSSFSTFY